MLHAFLERPLGPGGCDDAPRRTRLERLFTGGRLGVARHLRGDVADAFLARPVLRLRLAALDVSTYAAFRRSFTDLLHREFRRHRYLVTANRTPALFADPSRLLHAGSAAQLARLLRAYHGRQVIFFLEEHDQPLMSALEDPRCSDGDLRKMVAFLGRLVKGVMNCGHVDRSLVTGCSLLGRTYTRVASSLVYLRNFDHPAIAKYYGFSAAHVERLATTFRRGKEVDRMRQWYDRYRVEGTYSVFRPLSVLRYLEHDRFRPYPDPHPLPLLAAFQFDEISELVERSLTQLSRLEAVTDDTFLSVDELVALKRYLRRHELDPRWAEVYPRWVLQHLLDHGYYTVNNTVDTAAAVEIRVTNRERALQLRNALYTRTFLKRRYQITDGEMEAYVTALARLTQDRRDLFVEFMNVTRSLLGKPSVKLEKDMFLILYHAITSHEERVFQRWGGQKRVYKAFSRKRLKAIKVNGSDKERGWAFRTFSRVKWSRARPKREMVPEGAFTVLDIYVVTKDRVGIVLELKYDKTTAFRALEQIVDSQYYKIFSKKPHLPWALRSQVYIGVRYQPKTRGLSLSYLYNSRSLNKAVNITTVIPKPSKTMSLEKQPRAQKKTKPTRAVGPRERKNTVRAKPAVVTLRPSTSADRKVMSLIGRIVSKLDVFRSRTTDTALVATSFVTQDSITVKPKRRRLAQNTGQQTPRKTGISVDSSKITTENIVGKKSPEDIINRIHC
ncbi:unnamed protein product [Bemisia tabaci]|nr:unnamed protein product [Bemisia tabaci]